MWSTKTNNGQSGRSWSRGSGGLGPAGPLNCRKNVQWKKVLKDRREFFGLGMGDRWQPPRPSGFVKYYYNNVLLSKEEIKMLGLHVKYGHILHHNWSSSSCFIVSFFLEGEGGGSLLCPLVPLRTSVDSPDLLIRTPPRPWTFELAYTPLCWVGSTVAVTTIDYSTQANVGRRLQTPDAGHCSMARLMDYCSVVAVIQAA